MSVFTRILRHGRLSLTALHHRQGRTPPFLTVYMNSICNLTCEHCYYWRNLNQRDDLTLEEFSRLSAELGGFENLNLSGGEPFIRSEFAEVCTLFIRNNGVRQIYVPTSGYFTERTEKALRKVLQEPCLQRFVCDRIAAGVAVQPSEAMGDGRWSTQFGAHLVKCLHGLYLYARAFGEPVDDEVVAALINRSAATPSPSTTRWRRTTCWRGCNAKTRACASIPAPRPAMKISTSCVG